MQAVFISSVRTVMSAQKAVSGFITRLFFNTNYAIIPKLFLEGRMCERGESHTFLECLLVFLGPIPLNEQILLFLQKHDLGDHSGHQ